MSIARQRRAALAVAAVALAPPASAQMFHLYLACKGDFVAGTQRRPTELDLALRDNNQTALIQRADLLPVGERLSYVPSQTHYAMKYAAPVGRSGSLYVTWYRRVVVWWPAFEHVVTTQLSIDRQSGRLEGELLDRRNEVLGRLEMNCEPMRESDAPAPRL